MSQPKNSGHDIQPPNRIVETSNIASSIKQFVFSKLISARTRPENFFAPISDPKTIYHGGIGDIGGRIVEDLIVLPGIKTIVVEPYELRITISEAVDWELLMPTILEVMARVAFSAPPDEVDIQLKKVEPADKTTSDDREFVGGVSTR